MRHGVERRQSPRFRSRRHYEKIQRGEKCRSVRNEPRKIHTLRRACADFVQARPFAGENELGSRERLPQKRGGRHENILAFFLRERTHVADHKIGAGMLSPYAGWDFDSRMDHFDFIRWHAALDQAAPHGAGNGDDPVARSCVLDPVDPGMLRPEGDMPGDHAADSRSESLPERECLSASAMGVHDVGIAQPERFDRKPIGAGSFGQRAARRA